MKPATSKIVVIVILVADLVLSLATLALCALAIMRDYNGSLPYLTALIGLYQAATGYVLGKYMDKSKAENTQGGIVFEAAAAKNYERDL
jgi:hypothetical protein